MLFVIGASAVAAPLPVIEQGARIPRIALYVHIPTMLLILVLFRLFIFSAAKRGASSGEKSDRSIACIAAASSSSATDAARPPRSALCRCG